MSEIALRNVCKQFDSEHYGVKDFNLDIHDKEFVIFVGPSGCGKSTTLRIIAGLEEITDGELWIDGELSNYLEPKERGMSMVFQNYALYPNMTVYGNMAYALKIRKLPKDEIDRKVHEVAKILEIEQLLDRRPAALSGGQKQRVAIGSAIIRKPKAFLMDEPLSNLDAKLRAQMRVELVKLHKQLDTTIIYVTHDQTEAMTLGTKIVVMKDGLIQQVGAPQSIYDNPVNLFVAGFLGSPSMNFFRCTVKAEENNRTALLLDDAKTVKKVYLDGTRGKQIADRYNGRHVILGIRPEDIYELDEAKKLGIENDSVDVDEPVVNREMLGAEVILYFDEQGKTLAVRLKLYVGLGNYKELLQSASFINSLKVTLIFVLIVVVGGMLLGLIAAVLCNKAFPGIRVFSTSYALPMAIASSSAAMIFQIMLHPAVGIVNKLTGLDINWLNDPNTALICVAILTAWLNSGINFLYFSAGLGNIDETIYERASVDGASSVQQFFSLTLPGLSPIMFYTLVVNIIQAFQSFGQIKILTEGGPNESTNVIVYSIYRDAFFNYRFGSAAAQSVILFVIIMIITLIMFRIEKKGVNY